MEFLNWLQGWPFSEWVQVSDWGFPILLSFHSIGLAAVVGTIVMLNVRLLGFAKAFPVSTFANLMPIAWTGFLVNFVSGCLLFAADATRLVANWPFLMKMGCVLAGIVVAWLISRDLRFPDYQHASDLEARALGEPPIGGRLRILAVVSLALWSIALIGGRLIAYVADHQRMFKVDF